MDKRTRKDFIKPDLISRHLYCSICHQVFDDPMRTFCGHTFCYLCIESWASVTRKCPICKGSISQRKLEKDLLAAQIIDDLQIICVHRGCSWSGDYAIFKKHMRGCKYRLKKNVDTSEFTEFIDVDSQQEDCIMQTRCPQINSNHQNNQNSQRQRYHERERQKDRQREQHQQRRETIEVELDVEDY